MRCLQDACARVLRIHYSRRLVEHLGVFWDEVLPSSVRFVSVLRLARGGAQNRQQDEFNLDHQQPVAQCPGVQDVCVDERSGGHVAQTISTNGPSETIYSSPSSSWSSSSSASRWRASCARRTARTSSRFNRW